MIDNVSLAWDLAYHQKWILLELDGVRADLGGADLHEANLSGANLSWADLSWADLDGADLDGANLGGANLGGADLDGANLGGANLSRANLGGANLSRANLGWANLSWADLDGANLGGANLSGANLSRANLGGANLDGANLGGANLSGTNLSGANGILNPVTWLAENFTADDLGYIVFKAIGHTVYAQPDYWKIRSGAFLEEIVNPDRGVICACGVNFGTLNWVTKNNSADRLQTQIWRCRIRWPDLPGVIVPFDADGKARCSRLELLEMIDPL